MHLDDPERRAIMVESTSSAGIGATPISDAFMDAMLPRTRAYTVVLLGRTPRLAEPDAPAIIREHGRRNFALRAQGVLCVECPITDDGPWAGIGIFDATPEETATLMADDPAVRAGILTYHVHPVRSFPGDAVPVPTGGAATPRRPDELTATGTAAPGTAAPGTAAPGAIADPTTREL
jgi:hypothetical protein